MGWILYPNGLVILWLAVGHENVTPDTVLVLPPDDEELPDEELLEEELLEDEELLDEELLDEREDDCCLLYWLCI